MATRYAVETVFKIIDQFTNPLKSVTKEGSAIGNMMKDQFASAERQINAIPGKIATVGKYALGIGAGAIATGMGIATKAYINFDDAITAAGAKFKDLDVTSADYQDHLIALGETARKVAAKTQFDAVDTAGALDKMAMAGLTAKQSMRLLAGTADLATAAGQDLTSAVDMATDAMGAFNLMKDEMGNPLDEAGLATSLQRVSDVVAKTTNMANTNMNMWFEAVKKGAPTFTSLGGTIEDFSAIVGVLANSGIKGGEAGTAIRNMMLNISSPTKEASKALQSLGITAYDSAGNMLPILDIMKQFESAFGDKKALEDYNKALKEAGGDVEKVNIADFVGVDMGTKIQSLEAIFGKRTIGSMLVLMNEGTASIEKFAGALYDSEGAAADMANAMRQSLGNQLNILKSALTEFGFKFVEVFAPKATELIQKLTTALSTFDPTTLINGIVAVADVVGMLITNIWNLRGVIMPLIVAFTTYKALLYAIVIVTKIVTAVQTAWQVATGIATGIQLAHNAALWGTTAAIEGNTVAAVAGRIGMAAYAVVSKVAAAAQWILNASLFGCPITWIIAGIVALIAVIVGVVAVIKNWGAITEWLSGVWQNLVGAFQAGGIIGVLKQIGGAILSFLLAPIEKLMSGLTWIPGVGGKIAEWQNSLASFRAGLTGGENEAATTAPITARDAQSIQTERYITQSESNSNVTIGLEKGLTAQVSGSAPGVRVNQYHSGGF